MDTIGDSSLTCCEESAGASSEENIGQKIDKELWITEIAYPYSVE